MNHDILLNKLNYYGINGKANSWFKSYLTNRTQYTEVGDTQSEIGYIKCGVPQGSVLGPLLFLLYINDITTTTNALDFILFADDTTVIFSNKMEPNTENILNTELKKVSNWLASNKLSLNVSKSNFMHFTPSKRENMVVTPILDNTPVEEKETTKYLGVFIDNELNWKQHIQYVKTKLSKALGVISKIKYFTSKKVLTNLYYSFVQPYINYNLLNWSSANVSTLQCITNCIKKAVRIIASKNKFEHTTPIFKELKILPFDLQVKLNKGIFMWKIYKHHIPPPISNLFKQNNSTIMTRINPTKYLLPNPTNERDKRNLTYSCVKLWNTQIPEHLKILNKNFNKKYKSYLLQQL